LLYIKIRIKKITNYTQLYTTIIFIHILNILGVIASIISIITLLLCCMNALPLSINKECDKVCRCRKCLWGRPP